MSIPREFHKWQKPIHCQATLHVASRYTESVSQAVTLETRTHYIPAIIRTLPTTMRSDRCQTRPTIRHSILPFYNFFTRRLRRNTSSRNNFRTENGNGDLSGRWLFGSSRPPYKEEVDVASADDRVGEGEPCLALSFTKETAQKGKVWLIGDEALKVASRFRISGEPLLISKFATGATEGVANIRFLQERNHLSRKRKPLKTPWFLLTPN